MRPHPYKGKARAPEVDLWMDAKDTARFLTKFVQGDEAECWNWTDKLTPENWGRMAVRGKARKANRLAWVHFTGTAIPTGLVVCHRCDNPSCVNPKHLFLGFQRDNIYDMHSKGRGNSARGETIKTHKLTAHLVRRIRLLLDSGMSRYELSDAFRVDRSTICDVGNRRTWAHIQREEVL